MQINLDFSPNPINNIDPAKKSERIAVACSTEFKDFFQMFCKITHTNESELGYRYILDGMKNDLANIFIAQPHLDKSLADILRKRF